MEVFLSKEASQSFSALQCGLPNMNTDGFLIGHKRGNMFFVEKILPSSKGFFSSPQKYFKLKKKLGDKILGFYSFQMNERQLKKILTPFAYGKIFIRLDLDKTDRLEIKPFAIEHDQNFFLQPINLKSAL
jgi:hypothetical protein